LRTITKSNAARRRFAALCRSRETSARTVLLRDYRPADRRQQLDGRGLERRQQQRPLLKLSNRARWTILIGFTLVVTVACAARPMGGPDSPAFFNGVIDGLLASVSFVFSFFSDTAHMYAFPNVGRQYDFGFLLGIGCQAAVRPLW